MLHPAFGLMRPEELVFNSSELRKAWDSRAVGRNCSPIDDLLYDPESRLQSEINLLPIETGLYVIYRKVSEAVEGSVKTMAYDTTS
jgi:hypothetical protein